MNSRFLLPILLVIGVAALPGPARGFVLEQEPNNTHAQANAVACGDTVYCAALPGLDTDCFRFTVAARDSIVVTTLSCNGSQTNTLLMLFDPADSLLAADDNSGANGFSRIRWRAAQAGSYSVAVCRYTSLADCTYSLHVRCPTYAPEAYDLCTTPRIIDALPYFDETGSTLGMTDQCGVRYSADVFYQFYNPVLGNLFIELCTTEFDARVQLIAPCCTYYGDDENAGCGSGASLISFSVPPGDYQILVEGNAAGQAGHFSLEVTSQFPGCPPPGPVTLGTIGGYPFLDWPEVVGPSYFVVWQATGQSGPWEHLGTTPFTYYTDSTGFAAMRRYYQVTAVCPWSAR